MQTKVCSHCGRELPAEAFNKSSKSSTGLQSWCKECQKKACESRPKYPLARLATMGYKGKLEYTETHVIDINNF